MKRLLMHLRQVGKVGGEIIGMLLFPFIVLGGLASIILCYILASTFQATVLFIITALTVGSRCKGYPSG
ncbi:MAG: hypothetical protein WCK11_02315 [Candidatus Falkowbacteria bacterium]